MSSSLTHLFSNLSMYRTHLEGSFKHWLLGSPPLASDPQGLGGSLRICISDKSPGAAAAAGLFLENLCLKHYSSFFREKPQTAWVLESISDKRNGRTKVGLDFRDHPYCWGQDQLPLTYTGYIGKMSGTRRDRMDEFWMGNWKPHNPFILTGSGNLHNIHRFIVSFEEFSWPRFNFQHLVDFFLLLKPSYPAYAKSQLLFHYRLFYSSIYLLHVWGTVSPRH